MASNIVPFADAKLPSFLKNRKGGNSDLTSHVGTGGFPFLSIKGKTFTVVKNDERKVIEKADADGDMVPARAIEVVIIKANPNLSKNYYKGEYEEGSTASPDCFSNDGKSPDASVESPQAKSCATCPKNVWGSGRNGKGKACQDSRRVAIAAAGQINEPMLLRVPPASLKPLAEYAKMLDNRGADYDAVVTKLKFDSEAATPLLIFEAKGFLTEDLYAEVQEQKTSELVGQIIGTIALPPKDDKPKAAASDDEDEAPAPKKAKKAEVSDDEVEEAVKPAKKAKPVEDEDEAPAPKKEAKKPAKVVEEPKDDDLDAMLAELDD